MRYEIRQRDGIFEVITHGQAEVQTFRTFLREQLAHPAWRPGYPMLHDHSELKTESLTVQDVARIADFCEDSRELLGHSRLAVVLHRDLEFGLARMWSTFVDGRWDVTTDLFRSKDEAVSWLLAPPLPETAYR